MTRSTTAVAEATSTARSPNPYHRATVSGLQRVAGSSANVARVGQALTLQTRTPDLARVPRWSRRVQGRVQAQAGDERNRRGEVAASRQQRQRGIGAVRHGHQQPNCRDRAYASASRQSKCESRGKKLREVDGIEPPRSATNMFSNSSAPTVRRSPASVLSWRTSTRYFQRSAATYQRRRSWSRFTSACSTARVSPW